jgi:cytochrome c2
MLRTFTRILATAVIAVSGHMALADGHTTGTWTLNADSSKLAFGSVKKDTVGEVHSFGQISGTVGADGTTVVEIDLTSVQTNIDIRNERFGEHVFKGATTATLNTMIDMDAMAAMAVGDSEVIDVEAVLSFLGADVEIEAELFVARLSETSVMVTTNDMIFVGTEDLGISAGVDKLMELAKLPGITRTTPVTLRLIFNMDEQKAEAAPAAPAPTAVALAGDADAGKKVFKKCKACHSIKDGKHGVGPSLYKVVGTAAGAIENYKYSTKMAQSGLVWDAETLSAFLAKPRSVVKGTKMAFAGLKKADDIENVIAYIAAKSE